MDGVAMKNTNVDMEALDSATRRKLKIFLLLKLEKTIEKS